MTANSANSLQSPTPLAPFEQALGELQSALVSGELTELNQANEALRQSLQDMQAKWGLRPGNTVSLPLTIELFAVHRELRIAGELLARSSAANRRALSVFTDDPVSYGRNGISA
jgi:hypothetical protein